MNINEQTLSRNLNNEFDKPEIDNGSAYFGYEVFLTHSFLVLLYTNYLYFSVFLYIALLILNGL